MHPARAAPQYLPPLQTQGPPQNPLRVTTSSTNIVSYGQKQLGVSVYAEKEKAIAECKALVERIAKQCRAQNRKFRWAYPPTLFLERV